MNHSDSNYLVRSLFSWTSFKVNKRMKREKIEIYEEIGNVLMTLTITRSDVVFTSDY